jgi:LysM repeat protein
VSHKKIEQANPNVIPTRLKIGQKIIIPATQPEPVSAPAVVTAGDNGSMYTVKSGDTLGHIALRHRVDVADIKAVNNMNSDLIRIGQKIRLPVGEVFAPVLPSAPTLPPIPTPPTSGLGPSLDPGTGLPVGGTEGAAKPSEN